MVGRWKRDPARTDGPEWLDVGASTFDGKPTTFLETLLAVEVEGGGTWARLYLADPDTLLVDFAGRSWRHGPDDYTPAPVVYRR